jgi:two-component system heavy metal sensor histidine kinase CusS
VLLDVLVRDAVEHMSVVVEAKGLTLEGGDLAPCPVRADPDQLRRLTFNLLDNAIKFTPTGGTIRIGLERSEGQACLYIADSGVGIPAEHIPHLFDRFYRVDPSRGQETEGTGLGLAICRSIAEAHGGQVRIESVVGRGTRATFVMPASADNAVMSSRTDSVGGGNSQRTGSH